MPHRHNSILTALRARRSGRLGRVVVALYAITSVTIMAAPCSAMAPASADAHESAQAAGAHDSHGHDSHSHAQSAGHHAHSGVDPHHDATPLAPPHCPHCPLTAAPSHVPSSTHSSCSVVDDVSEQTSVTFKPPAAKQLLLVATFEPPPSPVFHPPPRQLTRAFARGQSAIALNLRHCVFLI